MPAAFALPGDPLREHLYTSYTTDIKASESYTSVDDTACGETPSKLPIHSQVATSMLARPWATPGLSLGPRGCVVVATLSVMLSVGYIAILFTPRNRVQAFKPNTVLST